MPDHATLRHLALGGAAGLLSWELFARVITPAILGYPLEPAGLIDAILRRQFGFAASPWLCEALHYAVGLAGYPIAYLMISRHVPRWSAVLDLIVFIAVAAGAVRALLAGHGTLWTNLLVMTVMLVILSRFAHDAERVREAVTWGMFTAFNALGLMAPLGGLSFFLLREGGALALMSVLGHLLYGVAAVLVFAGLETRRRSGQVGSST
jgi:hypothetical protein